MILDLDHDRWEVTSRMHSRLKNGFHQKHRVTSRHLWNIFTITDFLSYAPDTFEREKMETTKANPYSWKMTTRDEGSGLDVLLNYISQKACDWKISAAFPKSQEICIRDKFQKLIGCGWNAYHSTIHGARFPCTREITNRTFGTGTSDKNSSELLHVIGRELCDKQPYSLQFSVP